MSERVTCPKCGNDLGGLFVLSDNPRVLDENPLFSEWLRAAVAAEREKFRCPICKHEPGCSPTVVCEGCFAERIEEVRSAEREACAKLCDEEASLMKAVHEVTAESIAEDLAAAIRGRGETT